MYIIAGLGNPKREYFNTRHNAGFMAIDVLARELDIKMDVMKHRAMTGTGYFEGEKVMLMKPMTFMNLSGASIGEAVSFYKIDPSTNLLIIYDDINLPPGKLRLRSKGSAGGHNGIKSVISHLGTDMFRRIKLGVGGKPEGYDLADYVLSHFSKEEQSLMDDAFAKASDAAKASIRHEFDKAMNLYNQR
ncbi:MAG: aminoacyl-tRNA hydrolase [Clostridiales bacterium]|nr:aminoacyl-tRNA hydrolase [Clostridiales bacterium]